MYTLESDDISKGLQVKAKSNGGTSKGSEGVFPTYLISKIDDLSLQKDTANEIAVQTKSGGGISKGSEGVFQTYEISGVASQTLEKHLVQYIMLIIILKKKLFSYYTCFYVSC